jgi:hypothetical protein
VVDPSLFQSIFGGGESDTPDPRTGLTTNDRATVGFGSLANIGALLMAAGQPMYGNERARILAQLGNVPGQMSDMQTGMVQRRRVNQQYESEKHADAGRAQVRELANDPRSFEGLTPGQAALLKAAYLTGDIAKVNSAMGGSSNPMLVREFGEWKKDPRFASKSYADFIEWRANIGANKDAPAAVREFNAWQADPANAKKGLSDFYKEKAQLTAQGKELGKTGAEAEMALPALEADLQTFAEQAERVKNHPGLSTGTGMASYIPNRRGSDAYNFVEQLGVLQGQAFLGQFGKLRGAGAITETEGKKATDALVSLNVGQSSEEIKKGIDTALEILNRGRDMLRQKAAKGQGTSATVQATPPAAAAPSGDKPPMPGAQKAPDNKWYVQKDGKYFEVR